MGGYTNLASSPSTYFNACRVIQSATVQSLVDANKALHFAKHNTDVGLEYVPLGDMQSLTLTTFTDAAFACRHDNARR